MVICKQHLTNLEICDITQYLYGSDRLYGDISVFANCSKLNTINLTNLPKIYGDVKVFEFISNKNWYLISLYGTSISGNLSSFKDISVSYYFGVVHYTQVTGDISNLSNMKNVSRLALMYNSNITGDISIFKTFTNLRELAVNNT